MAGALSLLLAACEDTSDLGIMQVNKQPVVVESNGVKTIDVLGASLDLNNYQNINLPVLDVEMKSDFPASATIGGTLEVSTTADFDKSVEIPIFSEAAEDAQAEEGYRRFHAEIEGNNWENAFVDLFGSKAPEAHDMYYRYMILIQDGSQSSILKYEDKDFWPVRQIEVSPVDLKFDVAGSYFVKGNYANMLPMVHAEGLHQYDDPNFSIVFAVSEAEATAGYTVQIVSGDDNTKVYGPAASTDIEASWSGRIVEDGEPFVIKKDGKWRIEVNMYTRMCKVYPAFETLWVPSTGNNIKFTRNCQQLPTEDYQTYQGAAFASKYFGLTSEPSFKGFVYGMGAAEGKLAQIDATISKDNGIAIPKEGEGLFWIKANIVDLTYSFEAMTNLGIVGSMTNWGNDNPDGTKTPDIALKASKDANSKYTIWTGTATFEAGDQFKIRCNNEWVIDFGTNKNRPAGVDQYDDVTRYNADNFVVKEAGTYTVTINFQSLPYKVTLTPKK